MKMNEAPEMIPEQNKESKYSFARVDLFAAIVSLVLGFLYVCVVPVRQNPLGAMLYVILVYGLTLAFIYLSGRRPDRFSLILAAIGIAFSAGFIISSTALGWLFLFQMLLYIYFVYSAFGNQNEKGIGRWFWLDAVKSATVMPLSSLDALIRALVPSKKDGVGKKIATNILWIFLGLLVAIVPTLIIAVLLSYDNAFGSLMDNILNAFDISNIADIVWKMILAVPVALYGFGHLISSKLGRNRDWLDEEKCQRLSEQVKFLPTALSCAAMLPILALYVIFFISQWGMYMSAFTGILPEELTYAEYARQGFFELCAVCGINAALILGVNIFTKQNTRTTSIILRVIKGVTSFFSIILAATALSKMFLYIGVYGLTLKRVLASWFIILLLVAFVLVIIYQIWRKFRFNAALVIAFAVMFGGLMFCDVPTLVAEYNTEAYLSGRLESVDMGELYYRCGEAGIPSLVRLNEESTDYEICTESARYIRYYKERILQEENDGERGFFAFSVTRAKAEHAIGK